MSMPPTNTPVDIDSVIAVHTRRRPRWIIPILITVVLALITTALLGLGQRKNLNNSNASSDVTSPTGNARTLDEIKSSGTIRIGVFSDKSPFGSVNSQGTYVGYDITYAERIAQDLHVKLELVPVEAASRVEFLTSGKVDAVLANFTVTPERARKVDFANPYMKVSLGIVSPNESTITNISQLRGKKIIVVKGTTAETYLTREHSDLELLSFEQYTEATNALLDGRGAAWVTDNTEALAFSLQNKEFSVGVTTLGPQDTIAAAVTKGNTSLLNWLNEDLVALGNENFFHNNFEKTLKPTYGESARADDLVVEGGKV
ncbi:MAG: transporter substrate-binding domain-containing protein [Propionibacteriaceae bacterium]